MRFGPDTGRCRGGPRRRPRLGPLIPIGLLLALGAGASSCGCGGPHPTGANGTLYVAPPSLDFGARFVGTSAALVATVTNEGRAPRTLVAHLEAPFVVDDTELVVPPGSTDIRLRFEPHSAGAAAGTLSLTEPSSHASPLTVALVGVAQPIPACAPAQCHRSHFDVDAGACLDELAPDDTPCASACLPDGVCARGECVGTASASCDDGDACSVDACASDGGCVHFPRVCPVADSCLASYCDPASGCATAPLPDGTLCGDGTCRLARVCMNGVCQTRPKPNADDECTAVDLATNGVSTCMLTRAGSVRCWGAGYASGGRNWFASVGTLPFAGRATTMSMDFDTCASLESGDFQCFDGTVKTLDAGAGVPIAGVTRNYQGSCWLLASGAVQCDVSATFPGGVTPFGAGITSLASDPYSFCATRDDGGVVCWGYCFNLAPVDGGLVDVPVDAPARWIRPGGSLWCATLADGVSCWRSDHSPQRLPGDIVDVSVRDSFHPAAEPGFVAVMADGGVQDCVIGLDAGLACASFLDAGALPAVRRAAAGFSHDCFLTEAGDVACTGQNWMGQLGDLSPAPPGARQVGVHDVALSSVSAGITSDSVAVVQRDGGILLWGLGTPAAARVPLSGTATVDLLTLPGQVCVLRASGSIDCQNGAKTFSPSLPPIARFVGSDVVQRGSGALDGLVWCASTTELPCWFTADGTQAGCAPAAGGLAPLQRVQGLFATSCDLEPDAGVECEGNNRAGQLGTGDTVARSGRLAVPGLRPVRKVGMTADQACALERTGRILCWGLDVEWQVHPPTPVLGLLPFARDLACGSDHCCALVGDNAVSCWGQNRLNQLGREGPPSDLPREVPMPNRVEQLSAGGATTCARLQDGELWCWGDNHQAQLGFAPVLFSTDPVWVTR